MKAIIFAGGYGTRLAEETDIRPKPMVEVGGKPILWHIMKIYSYYGINDFIICIGYKGYMIKEYFLNYYLHNSDVTFDLCSNSTTIHQSYSEPWKITLVDTGIDTMTGGRLKRVKRYVGNESFCLTYGDGVSDVNIKELINFHKQSIDLGILTTITAVMPQGRYGSLDLEGDKVSRFIEKPQVEDHFINGGFFVLEPKIFDYIEGDNTPWEAGPIEQLVKEGKVQAYKHNGFWQPMDTLRDNRKLQELWENGRAPWKKWE